MLVQLRTCTEVTKHADKNKNKNKNKKNKREQKREAVLLNVPKRKVRKGALHKTSLTRCAKAEKKRRKQTTQDCASCL